MNRFPESGPLQPPQGIRLLLGVSLLVQGYALGFGVLLLFGGVLIGLLAIEAGVAPLLLVLALLTARWGLVRGSRAALWFLRLILVLIASALPAFAITRNSVFDWLHAIFPTLVTTGGVALLLLTFRRDVRGWVGRSDSLSSIGMIRDTEDWN